MAMPLPSTAVVKATTTKKEYSLTALELKEFQKKRGFSDIELAKFLGVTVQCVRLWVRDQREINMTVSKVIRLITKYPQLEKEF